MILKGGLLETKEAILSTISELSNIDANNEDDMSKSVSIDIKEIGDNATDDKIFDDELVTLLRLKEKSLVLFEGLKNTKDSSLETKLNMVISYLEYQLYVIEDRLMTLEEMAGGDNDRSDNDRR